MTKPIDFTPSNSSADVDELQAPGGQRPVLQVSALSSQDAWNKSSHFFTRMITTGPGVEELTLATPVSQ
ncbi:UNVERIFIED_CONTAM: hypothetical protein FKN15_029992 [Acipenser sinensis]